MNKNLDKQLLYDNITLSKTLILIFNPNMESSIFTAEAHAIDLALNIISKSKHKKFIIFSHSLSVLLSLRNKKFQNPLIIKLLSRLDSMSNRKEIIGVRGNERADSAAKLALDLTPNKSRFPYTHLKPTINKFLHTKWQQQWSNNILNKLFQIQPTFGEWKPASRKSRREQIVISRLRIGHTRLTHSFILKQKPQPQLAWLNTFL